MARPGIWLKVNTMRLIRCIHYQLIFSQKAISRWWIKTKPRAIEFSLSCYNKLLWLKEKIKYLWYWYPAGVFLISSIILVSLALSIHSYNQTDELEAAEAEIQESHRIKLEEINKHIINRGEFIIPQNDLEAINAKVGEMLGTYEDFKYISSYITENHAYYTVSYEKLVSVYKRNNSTYNQAIENKAYEICWNIIASWQEIGYYHTTISLDLVDSRNLNRVIFNITHGNPITYRAI